MNEIYYRILLYLVERQLKKRVPEQSLINNIMGYLEDYKK